MEPTPKEPSEEQETPTTESKTEPLDIHEYYHGSNHRYKCTSVWRNYIMYNGQRKF